MMYPARAGSSQDPSCAIGESNMRDSSFYNTMKRLGSAEHESEAVDAN